MQGRSGPFWDVIEGRKPLPPAAATLGLDLKSIKVDSADGSIEISFNATQAFTNPVGEVLGGFIAAMLYDTTGPALLATLEPHQFHSTLSFNVNFLRSARPGRLIGRGRVVHRHGDEVVVEASLFDAENAVIASATTRARVVALRAPQDGA